MGRRGYAWDSSTRESTNVASEKKSAVRPNDLRKRDENRNNTPKENNTRFSVGFYLFFLSLYMTCRLLMFFFSSLLSC